MSATRELDDDVTKCNALFKIINTFLMLMFTCIENDLYFSVRMAYRIYGTHVWFFVYRAYFSALLQG